MLVFWHYLNLNGPQFDCEINNSLRLTVGVGCHSHHFQSYCLSGMQRRQHHPQCTPLTSTSASPKPSSKYLKPESGLIHTADPFPTLVSLIQEAIRATDLEPDHFLSLHLAFFLLNMEKLNEPPKILSTGLCLDQRLTSDPRDFSGELPSYWVYGFCVNPFIITEPLGINLTSLVTTWAITGKSFLFYKAIWLCF